MTTTPEQIDVLRIPKGCPLPALLGLIFYLRDNPMTTPRDSINQIKTGCCLFKRLPFGAFFSGKGGGND